MSNTLLLLSGGMDSTTLLWYLKVKMHYTNITALSIDYGQRHKKEIQAAEQIARKGSAKFIYAERLMGEIESPLLTQGEKIPLAIEDKQELTVVPGRNAFLLSCALPFAIQMGANAIFFAPVLDDFKSYPDCRPQFVSHMSDAFTSAYGVGIYAPFISMWKVDVVRLGLLWKVPYQLTWTCYKGEEIPCMVCDACIERGDAFATLNRNYYGEEIR